MEIIKSKPSLRFEIRFLYLAVNTDLHMSTQKHNFVKRRKEVSSGYVYKSLMISFNDIF